LPDGSVQSVSRGWLFYTDPDTGEYISNFRNPYTNEVVDMPVFRAGISGDIMTVNGPQVSANFTMESTVYGRPPQLDHKFFGGQAFVSRSAFTRWQPRGLPNKRIEMTLDVWQCKAADLFDASKSHIPSHTTWTSQTEFQTWLNMPAVSVATNCGDRTGFVWSESLICQLSSWRAAWPTRHSRRP